MEDSRAAANLWWEAKRLEIDQTNQVFALDTGRRLVPVRQFPHGWTQTSSEAELLNAAGFKQDNEYFALYGSDRKLLFASPYERGYLQAQTESRQSVKVEETIGSKIDEYLAYVKRSSKPRSYKTITFYTRRIADIMGRQNSVHSINEKMCSKVWSALADAKAAGEIKPTTAKLLYVRFKTIVHWLVSENIIDRAPRNLTSNKFKEGRFTPTVLPIPVIRQMLAAANKQTKLLILLGLNCAFTRLPIAHFDRKQIKDGCYIDYYREKTENTEGIPPITFRLWPETSELLDEVELPATEDAVSGVWKRFRDSHAILFASVEQKRQISQGAFRSTAATLFYNSEWSRYTKYFMGQKDGDDILTKHYAVPSQEKFDEMLLWLRSQVLGT